MKDMTYGRKDAQNESEVGDVINIPTLKNYRENLKAKGFTDEEIVALSSIESFGATWDPLRKSGSPYPKLDNYHYKQLLVGKGHSFDVELLNNSKDLKPIFEKFA